MYKKSISDDPQMTARYALWIPQKQFLKPTVIAIIDPPSHVNQVCKNWSSVPREHFNFDDQ